MTDKCTSPTLPEPGKDGENPSKDRILPRKALINALNRIHFRDETVIVNFKHRFFNRTISLKAIPQPCTDTEMNCRWEDPELFQSYRDVLDFSNIYVPHGSKLLLVTPEVYRLEENGIHLELPDNCLEVNRRHARRHPAKKVDVQFIQSSVVFSGDLVSFTPDLLEVRITPKPNQNLMWVNPESPAMIILQANDIMLYSGECRIRKEIEDGVTKRFLLKPGNDRFRRFEPKKFRHARQKLVPSPTVIFRHPFTGKVINLIVFDLAAGGLSVVESPKNALLLPGMVIPEMQLDLAGSPIAKFRAQVLYRSENQEAAPEKETTIRCGLTILEMSLEDHSRLTTLLHNATNENFFLSDRFDAEELWDFFFETGFIYPRKYETLALNKRRVQEIYEKLYTTTPVMAKHFIYRDARNILGHIALIHAYSNSWMIQHHAANTSASKMAGLTVLNQVGRFINDTRRLHSAQMRYIFGYFRPQNRFPNRIFGGAAQSIGDLKGCSMDTFAYAHLLPKDIFGQRLQEPWRIEEARKSDLNALEYFYESTSGGLMLDAMDLRPESPPIADLASRYNSIGLRREKKLFSLFKGNRLMAVVMVNISDTGLNLSELTNGIQIFVIENKALTSDIIHSVIYEMAQQYYAYGLSVLIYPYSFAENNQLFDRHPYRLWVVDSNVSDQYFNYLKDFLRFVRR